jgi:hypothetical protein
MADPTSPTPAATPAAAPAASPTAAAPAPADPAAAFQAALAAHDASAAARAWNGMQAKEKKAWKGTPKQLEIIDAIGPGSVMMTKESGASYAQSADLGRHVLAHPDPAAWLTPMAAFGTLHEFADAHPRRGALTDQEAKAVATMTLGTAGGADAKKYFEKAYPSLRDRTYGAGWLWTRAWAIDDVKRMVRAVVDLLPHQHVQTITGGFYIGTHIIETGKTKKEELGYAFYDGGRIVMPSDSTANGGTTQHDMVLGGASSENPLNPSGLMGMTDHFDGSALHEVGHGVGEHSDGNSWATTNGYTDFKKEKRATAVAQLWDDAAADAAVAGMAKANVIAPRDARNILARYIEGGTVTPPKGWKTADAVKFLKDNYSAQKLYQYARVKTKTDDVYKFAPGNNVVGGRAYTYLTRWDNSWASYTEKAYNEKVSWYSLSSPLEWFAEQYVAYYQFGPNNSFQPDVVKDKLKAIGAQKFSKGKLRPPTSKGGASGAPAASAGSGGPDGMAGEEAQAEAPGTSAPPSVRRAAFAW